jgi:Tfp pilus assembly protein PilV
MRADQRGETLIEILVTVSIMSIAFVGILAGIGMTFSASDSHRQEATGESVLRDYAERVEDPVDSAYVNCATTANYASPIGFALPTGWTASVTKVLYWQGDSPPSFLATVATCPTADKGLQQLTLTAQSPAGAHQATVTVAIVKRKP